MLVGGLSERTRSERLRIVRNVARDTGVRPDEFTSADLLTWLGMIRGDSSRLTYFRALQAWHRWLVRLDVRTDDPTTTVPRPREPKRRPHPVATQGIERLLTSGIRRRTQAMVLLKCYSGLRVSEVARVRGEDVDLDGRRIRVLGKGGAVRWLPLHPALELLAGTFPREGWWFPSTKHPGRPMRRDTASSTISRAMKRAGVSGTAHGLRHWYGTESLGATGNLRVTQELLRHENVATTQIYTEVTLEQMRDALLRLPRFGHP